MVHEVGQPAEEEPDRSDAGDVIVDPERGQLLLPAEVENAEDCSDETAVEGHGLVLQ